MPRKISTVVKIIQLLHTLSDDERKIVTDYIRSQTTTPRKGKKKVEKDPICATCGNMESFADHNPSSDVFHKFRTTIKKKESDQ